MAAGNISGMRLDDLLEREWLATNGLGGFACSTLPGLNTRKYHGLLVAAMAPPVRRMVILSRVEETVRRLHGNAIALACSEYPGTIFPHGYKQLRAFAHEPFPRWAYQGDGWTLEKSLRSLQGENTVVLTYTLLACDGPVELGVRPLLALRGIHELTFQWNGQAAAEQRTRGHYQVPATSRTPQVFFAHDDPAEFESRPDWYRSNIYRRESERGYAGLEDLWTPGVVRCALSPGQSVHVAFSTEPFELSRVVADADRHVARGTAPVVPAVGATDARLDALRHATDQYTPVAGTLVTQYPWAPPSLRDALIALPGLLLVTRRFDEARQMLVACVDHLDAGLLPSEFPEDGSPPKYDGADTSLWFINAVHQYLRYSDDGRTVGDDLLDAIVRIIRSYQSGTALGIRVDADGLVASHMPALPTSWMDAKVGDWVITLRQGRPVELNALWYNALRIAAELCGRFEHAHWAEAFAAAAGAVKVAFNRRFWNVSARCLYDVVGEHAPDASIRPNQLFAISLPYPVLDEPRWAHVMDAVRTELLTPMGVCTLSPRDPSFQRRYAGDVVARDRAYHQGCAYPWLLGPYVTAHVRTFARSGQARRQALEALDGCIRFLQTDGLGHIPELFDGSPPHRPGGAIACARSTGEILRAYAEDVCDAPPRRDPPALSLTVAPNLRSIVEVRNPERTSPCPAKPSASSGSK